MKCIFHWVFISNILFFISATFISFFFKSSSSYIILSYSLNFQFSYFLKHLKQTISHSSSYYFTEVWNQCVSHTLVDDFLWSFISFGYFDNYLKGLCFGVLFVWNFWTLTLKCIFLLRLCDFFFLCQIPEYYKQHYFKINSRFEVSSCIYIYIHTYVKLIHAEFTIHSEFSLQTYRRARFCL